MVKEYKYLTKEAIIATGSSAGLSKVRQEITSGYERVVGMAFVEATTGGNTFYKIGLSDDTKQYIDPVPVNLLKVGTDIELDKRFLSVDVPGNGNIVYIDVVLPAATSSEMKFYVIFKLQKGEIAKKSC